MKKRLKGRLQKTSFNTGIRYADLPMKKLILAARELRDKNI